MRRSHLGLASLACVVSVLALLGACGGTSDVTIPPATSGADGSTAEGSVPPSEGGATKDATTTSDATDPPRDAGVVVTEEPSPSCHDLEQIAAAVTPTSSASPPPDPLPIASIPPGLYVAKAITFYGMVTNIAPQRITAYFNGTREYYIAGSGPQSNVFTIDYKVSEGTLSRTIVCPDNARSVDDARIGASQNGFTLFLTQGDGSSNAVETVRYELSNGG